MSTLNFYVPDSERKAFDEKLKAINKKSQSEAIRNAVDITVFFKALFELEDQNHLDKEKLIDLLVDEFKKPKIFSATDEIKNQLLAIQLGIKNNG